MRTFRLGRGTVVCRKKIFSAELARTDFSSGALVFTDKNVLSLYGAKLNRYLRGIPVFAMEAGEKNKNEQTLFALLRAMAEAGLRRNSTLIVLGGGVPGDVGGLAASLYMRGISCIQIPTTLLAQVDSSVGGKTAVDFYGIKNLVGAFHQPSRVLVDPVFLSTLPPRELRCGLGEIVKHAALSGELFDRLTGQADLFDLSFLAEIVPQNIAVKAAVVKRDPLEKGLRRCLNLGHTTAHAIELADGTLSHGECVLFGILYEAEIARNLLPCDGDYLDALTALSRRVLAGSDLSFDAASAAGAALLDKKNVTEGNVALVLPVARGRYAEAELPFGEYVRELTRIRRSLC